MKFLIIASLLTLTSCATYAPLTYKHQCANKGMVLTGVNEESGSMGSYNWQTNAVVRSNYSGENVQCAVPKTNAEKCEADIYYKSAVPLNEYNSSVETKKFLTGLGYVAYVAPGIIAKVAFDNQRDEAVKQSIEIAHQLQGTCEEIEQPRVPASH